MKFDGLLFLTALQKHVSLLDYYKRLLISELQMFYVFASLIKSDKAQVMSISLPQPGPFNSVIDYCMEFFIFNEVGNVIGPHGLLFARCRELIRQKKIPRKEMIKILNYKKYILVSYNFSFTNQTNLVFISPERSSASNSALICNILRFGTRGQKENFCPQS